MNQKDYYNKDLGFYTILDTNNVRFFGDLVTFLQIKNLYNTPNEIISKILDEETIFNKSNHYKKPSQRSIPKFENVLKLYSYLSKVFMANIDKNMNLNGNCTKHEYIKSKKQRHIDKICKTSIASITLNNIAPKKQYFPILMLLQNIGAINYNKHKFTTELALKHQNKTKTFMINSIYENIKLYDQYIKKIKDKNQIIPSFYQFCLNNKLNLYYTHVSPKKDILIKSLKKITDKLNNQIKLKQNSNKISFGNNTKSTLKSLLTEQIITHLETPSKKLIEKLNLNPNLSNILKQKIINNQNNVNIIKNINNNNLHNTTCEHGNRTYNEFTSCPSKIRSNLVNHENNNPIIELDMKSSQLALTVPILESFNKLHKLKENTNTKINELTQLQKEQNLSNKWNNEFYFNYNISKNTNKKITLKTLNDTKYKLFSIPTFERNHDNKTFSDCLELELIDYKNLITSETFYADINRYHKTNYNEKEIKQFFFSTIFSHIKSNTYLDKIKLGEQDLEWFEKMNIEKTDINLKYYTTLKKSIFIYFKTKFPSIFLALSSIKGNNYRNLSKCLTRLESSIIKQLTSILKQNGFNYITVHDSIGVEEQDINHILPLFNMLLKDNGIPTTAKIKQSSNFSLEIDTKLKEMLEVNNDKNSINDNSFRIVHSLKSVISSFLKFTNRMWFKINKSKSYNFSLLFGLYVKSLKVMVKSDNIKNLLTFKGLYKGERIIIGNFFERLTFKKTKNNIFKPCTINSS